ncbi:hypothetical protein [Streptomyces sp. NBC_01373]|uniref:hypothetical protein n=1 Tax=Streptomyces sp. NBC_01373 TaxID=2903843 RepID=UPI002257A511|nr:hypothetical protein [Streptomyces sp. NBC_01373]MCX4703894.1 hypothetical protein [Streptomyces sp. NBC_01373]
MPTITGQMIHVGVGDKASGDTAVYWLRGQADELLYVGMSRNPMNRWSWHADTHVWWPKVVAFEVRWFGSREAAAEAELKAIKDGAALHNVHSTPRHGEITGAGVRRSLERQRAEAASR